MIKFAEGGQGYFDFDGFEIDFEVEARLVSDSYNHYRDLLDITSDFDARKRYFKFCLVLGQVTEYLFRMAEGVDFRG